MGHVCYNIIQHYRVYRNELREKKMGSLHHADTCHSYSCWIFCQRSPVAWLHIRERCQIMRLMDRCVVCRRQVQQHAIRQDGNCGENRTGHNIDYAFLKESKFQCTGSGSFSGFMVLFWLPKQVRVNSGYQSRNRSCAARPDLALKNLRQLAPVKAP